ncbi:WhiB family transcriptional regulator [Streptomyces violascens]|uniref:WhiB family transcriptional regulator n=1 Tax=Streptomyces violascens TaxID=67381 RepID=UPI00365AFB49
MKWPPLDHDWLRGAACVDEDPELFFPVGRAGPMLAELAAAKRVCGRCPVSRQCLSYALHSGQASGMWGGLAEEERARLRHRTLRAGR